MPGVAKTKKAMNAMLMKVEPMLAQPASPRRGSSAGGTLQPIAEADFDDLSDLGAAFNTDAAWRYELARISAA